MATNDPLAPVHYELECAYNLSTSWPPIRDKATNLMVSGVGLWVRFGGIFETLAPSKRPAAIHPIDPVHNPVTYDRAEHISGLLTIFWEPGTGFTFAADDQLTSGFLVASYSLSAKPKRGGIFTSLHVSQDEVESIMNAHATHFLLDKPRRQLTVSSSYMRRVTS